MKKWVCPVCGYVYEGENPPAECPVCHVSGDKFTLQAEEKSWAAEHVVGVGKVFGADVPEDVRKEIIDGLRANFEGECSEVGMYLAMGRVAAREGYPEIAMYWEKAGLEEAEHAAKFAELLGEVITDSTKKNLQMRVDAENGATAGKFELAKLAKKYNLDAIHDTVHEMARDEARHRRPSPGHEGLPLRLRLRSRGRRSRDRRRPRNPLGEGPCGLGLPHLRSGQGRIREGMILFRE